MRIYTPPYGRSAQAAWTKNWDDSDVINMWPATAMHECAVLIYLISRDFRLFKRYNTNLIKHTDLLGVVNINISSLVINILRVVYFNHERLSLLHSGFVHLCLLYNQCKPWPSRKCDGSVVQDCSVHWRQNDKKIRPNIWGGFHHGSSDKSTEVANKNL